MRFLLALTLALSAVAAPQAFATTVYVGDGFPGDPINPTVFVTDEAGELNRLTVSYTYKPNDAAPLPAGDGNVVIEDASAPLQAGEGCQELGGNRVRCAVDGLVAIRALLGGGADTATAESPTDDGTSCRCVEIRGGDADDVLTSFDGASLHGEAGADTLTGMPSTASGSSDPIAGVSADGLVGGPGNDVLDGGVGNDGMTGGPGDDVMRGGDGNDFMLGGESPPLGGQSPSAGRDRLDAGEGDDMLSDGDSYGPEIGPDELVAGAGMDTLTSYSNRTSGVTADLAKAAVSGAPGEGDTLVNFETVYGSRGDDTLLGDGDANHLLGLGGANTVRGRGGNDTLDASSLERNRLFGDRGDDVVFSQAWTPGSIDCGRGADRIVQPPRGQDSPRQPRRTDPGIYVSASCEAIGKGLGTAWAVDPVPNRPVQGQSVTLARTPGASFRKHSLRLTSADRPFRRLARARSTRRGVTFRLPERVARRARRRGMTFRVEGYSEIFVEPSLKLLWRFKVKRAR